MEILPLLGEAELYKKFRLEEPWDSPHNIHALKHMPDVYQSATPRKDGKTSIVAITGKGTMWDARFFPPSVRNSKDGGLLLIVDAGPDKAVPWTKPEDLSVDSADPTNPLGDTLSTGIFAIFSDWHIDLLRRSIDTKTLRAMSKTY